MMQDKTRTWRYANGKYPAPDGIRTALTYVGGATCIVAHEGRVFFALTESHFYILDPANGGHSVTEIERELCRFHCLTSLWVTV